MLLGAEEYGSAIDMWSAGCVVAEIFGVRGPLFNSGDVTQAVGRPQKLSQILAIFLCLGIPTDSDWPGISDRWIYRETLKVHL